MKKILVIHDPNLNLLGSRERHLYGSVTLQEIDEDLVQAGREWGVEVVTFQSNHEGDIPTTRVTSWERFTALCLKVTARLLSIPRPLPTQVWRAGMLWPDAVFHLWRFIFPISRQGRISGRNLLFLTSHQVLLQDLDHMGTDSLSWEHASCWFRV
jgi:hypothetical protein